MTTIWKYEDLEAWKTARRVTASVYRESGTGAFRRDFGLRNQICRAAVSMMSNIAEGFDSRTNRLFIEFLGRAKASGGEVRSQLYVALDQGYIDRATCCRFQNELETASRQIRRLTQYLESTHEQYSRR